MAYMKDSSGRRLDTFNVQPASKPTSASAGTAFNKPYDARFNLYNYSPPLLAKTRARLARALAGTGTAKLAFIGDSITNGNTVVKLTQSYPARVRAALTAQGYPSGGTGYTVGPFDNRWTFGAGWSQQSATKLTYQCTTNASTATFLSDVPGTIVNVYYRNTGAFSVAIDGAAPVNVAASSTGALRVYTVSGLTDAVHSVVITTQSGFTYIMGAEVARTTGVSVTNFGLSGSTAATWNVTDYDAPMQAVAQWAPDFIAIKLGTNDQRGGATTAAQYKTNLDTLIVAAKATTADVVLIAPTPHDGGTAIFAPYITKIYELAETHNLPVIDMSDRFGSYTSANALGLMSEGTHPNAGGYQEIATGIVAALF